MPHTLDTAAKAGIALLALACPLASAQQTLAANDEPNRQSAIEPMVVEEDEVLGFEEGTSLVIKPRTYYLNRNRDENPDNKGWALGGALEYKSGWWQQRLQVGTTVYTSQKLYGPSNKDGTLLFKPGPESFSVLGEANLTLRFGGNQGARVGRQKFELPYLGSHDIRMVPNTFEGVAVGSTAKEGFAYMAGYVDKIKRKNDDEFISMSAAAGAQGTDKGVAFGGARYAFANKTLVGAIYQHSFETFDTFFAKVEHPFQLNNDAILKSYLQYTAQQSTGDELIGEFDTSLLAGKLELKLGSMTYRLAASTTDDSSGIQKPYGNPANYLSVIVDDFDRAGEDAWLVGLSYDFGLTRKGKLTGFANIVSGDTPDNGANASPDEVEYDLTLDYRVTEGRAERMWWRFRAAFVDQDEDTGGDDFFDFRIIVNYDFDLI